MVHKLLLNTSTDKLERYRIHSINNFFPRWCTNRKLLASMLLNLIKVWQTLEDHEHWNDTCENKKVSYDAQESMHTLPWTHYAGNCFAGIVQLFWLWSLNPFSAKRNDLLWEMLNDTACIFFHDIIIPKHACEPLWAAILVYSMYSVCQPTTILYGMRIIGA